MTASTKKARPSKRGAGPEDTNEERIYRLIDIGLSISERARFLPRVTFGPIVVSPARWRMDGSRDRRKQIEQARRELGMPRHVQLLSTSHALALDLDGDSSDALIEGTLTASDLVFEEIYPPPEQSVANGDEGTFMNEVIVPFILDKHGSPHPI